MLYNYYLAGHVEIWDQPWFPVQGEAGDEHVTFGALLSLRYDRVVAVSTRSLSFFEYCFYGTPDGGNCLYPKLPEYHIKTSIKPSRLTSTLSLYLPSMPCHHCSSERIKDDKTRWNVMWHVSQKPLFPGCDEYKKSYPVADQSRFLFHKSAIQEEWSAQTDPMIQWMGKIWNKNELADFSIADASSGADVNNLMFILLWKKQQQMMDLGFLSRFFP